ncbi:MAG: ferritin-like domain-containing protein [Cyclobacteriaceae bacterium]
MAQTKSKQSPAKQSRASTGAKKSSTKPKQDMNGSLLEEFFTDALKDIYWAEKALTKALPKMSKAATSPELKKAFDQHLGETQKQIERLEQVFKEMGKKAQGKKCEAMQGLIDESESIISETKEDTFTRDAALIISAQKVEHYEIASYGGLVQLAKTMNKKGIANTLAITLKEEKKTDELLTGIAEKSINMEAAEEEGEKPTSLKESIMTIFSK